MQWFPQSKWTEHMCGWRLVFFAALTLRTKRNFVRRGCCSELKKWSARSFTSMSAIRGRYMAMGEQACPSDCKKKLHQVVALMEHVWGKLGFCPKFQMVPRSQTISNGLTMP
jgi:hypothetical protein